jgi:EAL and modified HD-GYP domain-containing signal transduction protein
MTTHTKDDASASSSDLLFARQPIFDCKKRLYAFELLYRDKDPNRAVIDDADKATSALVVNYCSSIITEENNPASKVFINLTKNLLLSDYFFPLEPKKIVIEILEDVVVDDFLIDRITTLRAKGYQFALDDYEFCSSFDRLLPLVDYIKIELLPFSDKELTEKVARLKRNHLNNLKKLPTLLAEKVEDQASYDLCKNLGFGLFQGYFLEKPMPVYGKKIKNDSKVALQIVSELQNPDMEIEELTHTISKDPNLGYQILKIVNSPFCRMPKTVESLHNAVVILGLEQIKKWAAAMALSGSSTQSNELFRILLIRARACELIATSQGLKEPESYFTVGLFSAIDAVLMADKQWLIEHLHFPKEINNALLDYSGEKGNVLKRIIDLEHGDFAISEELSEESLLDYYHAHETATRWANELLILL